MNQATPVRKSSALKKTLIGAGVVVALGTGLLAAIPFFYDIDQFRPQIQDAVNRELRGKVELGKLSFSLIPSVRIRVDGIKATAPAPYADAPLAQVESAGLDMPLWSLIVGPRATFRLVKAKVVVRQDEAGGNIAAFLPAPKAPVAPTEAAPPSTEGAPAAVVGQTLSGLPTWLSSRILAARFFASVESADVSVKKAGAPEGDRVELRELNLRLEDIGLRAPIRMSFDARPDVAAAGALVQGLVKASGSLLVDPTDAGMMAQLGLEPDFSGLDIRYAGLFHKPAGVTLGLKVNAKIEQKERLSVDLAPLEFRFADLSFATNAALRDVGTDAATVKAELNMPDVKLNGFGAFVPMVRSYGLDGSVALNGNVEGSLKDPRLDIVLKVKEAAGATPELKQPVSDMNGTIRIFGTAKDPQIKIEPLSMKIGRSDLSFRLAARGLEQHQVDFGMESTQLDLDELLGLKPVIVGAKGEGAATTTGTSGAPAAAPSPNTAPLDESLEKLAPTVEAALQNPLLDKVTAKMSVKLGKVRALGADFTQGTFQMSLAKRKLIVDKTGIGGYGGRLAMSAQMDLVPEALGVNFNSDLSGVRIEEMTRVHVPDWSKELTGALTGQMGVSLKGLRRAQVEKDLRGSLRGDVVNGRLSLPVMKVLGMVMDAVPAVGGKKLETPKTDKAVRGDFKTARIVSRIEGRRVLLEDLNVTYDTLDTKAGEVKFVAKGTVTFDRQLEMLGDAFLSPELIRVPELKGPSGQIEVPLKMSGDLANPKADIGYTTKLLAERLARGLLKGQEAALRAKLEEEKRKAEALIEEEKRKAQARIEEEKRKAEAAAKAKIEEEAKKAANNLKKKFGF